MLYILKALFATAKRAFLLLESKRCLYLFISNKMGLYIFCKVWDVQNLYRNIRLKKNDKSQFSYCSFFLFTFHPILFLQTQKTLYFSKFYFVEKILLLFIFCSNCFILSAMLVGHGLHMYWMRQYFSRKIILIEKRPYDHGRITPAIVC